MRWHAVTGVGVRINAHSTTAGRVVEINPAGRRLKIFAGIFGIDSALDRMQPAGGARDVGRKLVARGDDRNRTRRRTTLPRRRGSARTRR